MNATTTETKIDRITRAANGGGVLANQILGAIYALPTLNRKIEMIERRIERSASGAAMVTTDTEYADILIGQLTTLVDTMRYNHPDAARIARESMGRTYRYEGLKGLVRETRALISQAEETAALAR